MVTQTIAVPLEQNSPGRPRKHSSPRLLTASALVDSIDGERVLARRWTLHRARSGEYVREVGQRGEFLHRFVLELPPWRPSGLVVDHINHDRLDNRRENLRAVANVLNLANSPGRSSVYSLFKGVTFDRSRNRWVAQIMVSGKNCWLGRFVTEAEAALAYNAAALKEWGEHAQLNDI